MIPDRYLSQGTAMIEYFRDHPVIAAKELLGVELAPVQRLVFRSMWFKDYNIIVASRGFGKCVDTKSYVLVNGLGVVRLDEILPPIPEYLRGGDSEQFKLDISLYTDSGFSLSRRVSMEKRVRCIKICTKAGFECIGSYDHRILVFNKDCQFEYKYLKDIDIGDVVCIQRGQGVFGSNGLNVIEAYQYGLELGSKKAVDKDIPLYIRGASEEAQISFLRGVFLGGGNIYYTTSNEEVAKQLQLMLLNCGYVYNLRTKITRNNGSVYVLYRNNNDSVPYVWKLIKYLSGYLGLDFDKSGECLTYDDVYGFVNKVESIIETNSRNFKLYNYIYVLKDILERHYFFDRVSGISTGVYDCYDFEMDMGEEPNYFADGFINHNTFLQAVYAVLKCLLWPGYRVGLIGPVFRQAKHVFDAIDRLYLKSPIFQQACTKPPTKGSDSCYIRFKAPKGADGSWIEGIPLGDGTKIRGARFFLLCIDEFPHVPKDIYDSVIVPFAITGLDPMERVKYFERIERIKEMGVEIDDKDLVAGFAANKFIHTSSGYYKFNYMWDRMRMYWKEIKNGSQDHSVYQVPWWTLPKYFLDEKALKQSRKQMSKALFDMEYNALMVSDSDGFYSAAVLESVSQVPFNIELSGDGRSEYILSADPASGRDIATFSI